MKYGSALSVGYNSTSSIYAVPDGIISITNNGQKPSG
jgi:hypothetical protein